MDLLLPLHFAPFVIPMPRPSRCFPIFYLLFKSLPEDCQGDGDVFQLGPL